MLFQPCRKRFRNFFRALIQHAFQRVIPLAQQKRFKQQLGKFRRAQLPQRDGRQFRFIFQPRQIFQRRAPQIARAITRIQHRTVERGQNFVARIHAHNFQHHFTRDFFGRYKFHLVHCRNRFKFAFGKQTILARINNDHLKLAAFLVLFRRIAQRQRAIQFRRLGRVTQHRFSAFLNRAHVNVRVPNHRRRFDFLDNRRIGRARHQKHQPRMRETDRRLGH